MELLKLTTRGNFKRFIPGRDGRKMIRETILKVLRKISKVSSKKSQLVKRNPKLIRQLITAGHKMMPICCLPLFLKRSCMTKKQLLKLYKRFKEKKYKNQSQLIQGTKLKHSCSNRLIHCKSILKKLLLGWLFLKFKIL